MLKELYYHGLKKYLELQKCNSGWESTSCILSYDVKQNNREIELEEKEKVSFM